MFDLIGIGAGVFNLSLAALLDDIGHESHLFLETKEQFDWYPGLDTSVSELQDDYLGDLVTLTNPVSRYGFLSYLHERGLMYQFIGRKKLPLSRRIYAEYFLWASKKMRAIRYSSEVRKIEYNDNKFRISTAKEVYFARHIALGVGIKARLPDCAERFIGPHIYHSSAYSERNNNLEGKTVAVIGGGQSSAEILFDILSRCTPQKIIWISPNGYHASMDVAAISYDIWSPTYLQEFYKLDCESRKYLNKAAINTSDGITGSTLDGLYAKLFDKKYFDAQGLASIVMTNTRLEEVSVEKGATYISVCNQLNEKRYEFEVDELILATGYTQNHKAPLSALIADFPELGTGHLVEPDFSLKWKHAGTNKIYVQNGAANEFSVFERSLIPASWRSSMIINSLMGREIFKSKPDTTMHTYHDEIDEFEIKPADAQIGRRTA